MDEHVLAERLITYDTASGEGLRAAAGFVKGWLESRELKVDGVDHDGLPVILAEAGPADGPTVVFHGHLDVVPAREGQFTPRVEGDRLIGRGAYDMKGALAAMMCALKDVADQDHVRVRFVCVPDEESEDVTRRSTDVLVKEGLRGDFALTGEPTDLHIGVQAKGVLALRLQISGTAAHGSTPWLGDNAILKAHDAFRRIETLPFSRESSDLFDRPSINLARIIGGDAFNKVPDTCTIDVDIRFLPNQDPDEIMTQIRAIGDLEILKSFQRAPVIVSRHNAYVLALRDAVGRSIEGDALSIGPRRLVGRDLLHRSRHPRGRVRSGRRRPPRPARMGLDLLAGALSQGFGRLRQTPSGVAGAPGAAVAARSRRRTGLSLRSLS
jgi:succinyl-diaminopimelate desuccinylase